MLRYLLRLVLWLQVRVCWVVSLFVFLSPFFLAESGLSQDHLYYSKSCTDGSLPQTCQFTTTSNANNSKNILRSLCEKGSENSKEKVQNQNIRDRHEQSHLRELCRAES